MALQTTQRREERLGRPGMPYDSGTIDAVTRTAEVDGFRPGELALRGIDPAHDGFGVRKVEPTTAGPVTRADSLGLVRYLAARELADGATSEHAEHDTLAIITKGRVWVEVEDDVTDGTQAFVRVTAIPPQEVGAWRGDDDGGTAVLVEGVRFHGNSQDRDGTKHAVLFVDLG